MSELYANVLNSADGTLTTLSAAIATTDGISISTAGNFPAALRSGTCRIRIDNELMIATVNGSGVVTSVTRGAESSTAATHASGAKVRHILTAGGLLAAQGGGGGGGGASAAEDVTFTPAGTIASDDVQSAVAEVATDAASALTTHAADTTSVHGITDTSALIVTGDTRLADTRTPTDGSVTAAKVAAALKPSGTAAAGTEALRALGTTSSTAAAGNDGRLSDARTPTGAAGGVLGGTYPNPSFAADMATQAELDAHTGDSSAAHAASAISFSATGTIAATDAQAAVAEVATDAASALSTHASDETAVHGIPNTQVLIGACVFSGGNWTFDGSTISARPSWPGPLFWMLGDGSENSPEEWMIAGDAWFPESE